jgi:hypothetical protein
VACLGGRATRYLFQFVQTPGICMRVAVAIVHIVGLLAVADGILLLVTRGEAAALVQHRAATPSAGRMLDMPARYAPAPNRATSTAVIQYLTPSRRVVGGSTGCLSEPTARATEEYWEPTSGADGGDGGMPMVRLPLPLTIRAWHALLRHHPDARAARLPSIGLLPAWHAPRRHRPDAGGRRLHLIIGQLQAWLAAQEHRPGAGGVRAPLACCMQA